MGTIDLTKETQMGQILEAYPSARRALFQKFHIGGCSSCGYADTDTLGTVCLNHNISNVDQVVEHILNSHEADQKVQISARDAAALLKENPNAKLVDVRTSEEYQAAHIEGALLVDSDEKVQAIMTLPKDTPIVVHCHHGMRSLDAASYLIGHGFTNVKSMTGGIDAWSVDVDPGIPRY